MVELLIQSTTLVAAIGILIVIGRSATDQFLRIRSAKRFAVVGIGSIVVSKIVDVGTIAALLTGRITPAARADGDLVAGALSAFGVAICILAAWRWVEAGKRLESIADHESERGDVLHARLVERGLALSTVPAILYRARWSHQNPADATIEFFNDKIEDILGYERKELEKDLRKLLRLMHPEDRRRFLKFDAKEGNSKRRIVFEHRFRHRDGSYRWIRRHVRHVNDLPNETHEVVGCAFDVTDLKDAEARLQNFLDFAPDAVVTVNEVGKIVMANDRARLTFGLRDKDLFGRHVTSLFAGEFGDQVRHLVADEMAADSHWRKGLDHEVTCRQRDGRRFSAEINLSAVSAGDARLVAIGVRDISHRRETEAKLQQAQKMEAVGQLTGGIAHDFNNMLTVIGGNLEMMELDEVPENDRVHAQAARKATERAAELTARLLAFSRQQALEPENISINGLVGDVEQMLRRTIGEDVELATELADNLWQTRTDRSQLENALVNLCINARDAMDGCGLLEIKTSNVGVEDAAGIPDLPQGEYIRLTVHDNGAGIDEEALPRIFEPFYTTKERGKGSGLGLSMVYGFVRQSDGHIAINSKVGEGTTVSVYLPRSATDPSRMHEVRIQVGVTPTGSERILVVEDNPSVRKVARDLLTSLNYEVIEADSGPSALQIFQKGERFDLLFTDLVMPGGLTGIELAESMLKDRPNLKVLYTSGYAGVQTGAQTPVDASVLHKPYLRDVLAKTIREALDE